MSRMAVALIAIATCRVASAQTLSSTWNITTETDKLSDRQVATATATANASGHSAFVYELTLKCDGSNVETRIATFDQTNTTAGEHSGRAISWKPINNNGSMTQALAAFQGARFFVPFRYRIDSGMVESGMLIQSYGNAGVTQGSLVHPTQTGPPSTRVKLTTMLGHSQEEVQHLFESSGEGYLPERRYTSAGRPVSVRPGFRDEAFCESAGAPHKGVNGKTVQGIDCGPKDSPWVFYNVNQSSLGSVYKLVLTWQDGKLTSVEPKDFDLRSTTKPVVVSAALPRTRVVVADIFPDETVEFPFNNLTPEQRSTLQSMCFAESK